jgi:DNA-directed RNA polymerase sigma subunit (sigma70/sigma32)
MDAVRLRLSRGSERCFPQVVDSTSSQGNSVVTMLILAAAEKLVTAHLRLVAWIVVGYRGCGLPLNELISEGNIGMIRALRRCDSECGFRLAAYVILKPPGTPPRLTGTSSRRACRSVSLPPMT